MRSAAITQTVIDRDFDRQVSSIGSINTIGSGLYQSQRGLHINKRALKTKVLSPAARLPSHQREERLNCNTPLTGALTIRTDRNLKSKSEFTHLHAVNQAPLSPSVNVGRSFAVIEESRTNSPLKPVVMVGLSFERSSLMRNSEAAMGVPCTAAEALSTVDWLALCHRRR